MTPAAHARAGTLWAFGLGGFALASWMSRIPDVREALDLSAGELGVLLLSLSVGSLIGLPLAGRITGAVGASRAVRFGVTLAVPGLVLAAFAVHLAPHFGWVMPGLFLFGLGVGVWDVAQNLEGAAVERAVRRAIMPWFHAAFSAGTVLGALVGAGLTALRVPILAHIVVVAAVTLVMVLRGAARFIPVLSAEPGAAGEPSTRSGWTEPRTILIGVMVLAAAFTEGTANDWLAVAFVDGHQLDKALGVLGLAVFLVAMTAGRILGTALLDRHGRVPVLFVLFVAALVGCLLVVFGTPPLAFAGAAIWGVGASLGFPVGMSAAADDPARAPARVAVVSTIGYTAFLAGPPLLGFLGDHIGILRALLAVGVVSLAALLVLPAARPLPSAPGDPRPARG